MKRFRLSSFVKYLRTYVSDFFTNIIATWKFVIFYTVLIFLWIYLHKIDVLTFDTSLNYCNFFLCWLAGIQASIVMMSDNRKVDKHFEDTKKDLEVGEKTLEVDIKNKELIKRMSEKVTSMVNKINKLEEIIELMEKEEEEKINGKRNSKIKTKFRRED